MFGEFKGKVEKMAVSGEGKKRQYLGISGIHIHTTTHSKSVVMSVTSTLVSAR